MMPREKKEASRNPDSKVTHVHLFSVSCVNAIAYVWVPAVRVRCNFGLIWLEKLICGAKEKEKLQSNNS